MEADYNQLAQASNVSQKQQ